ncbi:acyl-CoA dehydratase activase [Metallumcola ferriviriculae]|uniref:Acyl-CoA dehydratase activase n=1 Tax=Metallumcola ferriviriculae TaxID=3039180 RepID=A0AAU0UQ86_9FIRM|nr:acyl-CoA dehydratase activase [Desulfitibacteraceae bacterium MK1]
MQQGFLGIDVGSVSTNFVILAEDARVIETLYIRTKGQPIKTIKAGLQHVRNILKGKMEIIAAGATGSARNLSGIMVGADIIKNEITAHAVAVSRIIPDAQTIFEIGGQDSKIIILRNGIVTDFAMNTVCAAGTGSFLDQQASRLSIPIEDFGKMALAARNPVRIAGRCGVFAESDMIHKQQLGYNLEEIIAGLCEALVRNYLNNVGKGKEILAPIVFQGGVAANGGIAKAFEEILGQKVTVPKYYDVMGALGVAYLALRNYRETGITKFKGLVTADYEFIAKSFECKGCANNCEIINIHQNDSLLARWGSRCGKWEHLDH